MTEQQLNNLTRTELIDLLASQTRYLGQVEEELGFLRTRLNPSQRKRGAAEVSADALSRELLENSERVKSYTRESCRIMMDEVRERARTVLTEAYAHCEEVVREAEAEAARIVAEANIQAAYIRMNGQLSAAAVPYPYASAAAYPGDPVPPVCVSPSAQQMSYARQPSSPSVYGAYPQPPADPYEGRFVQNPQAPYAGLGSEAAVVIREQEAAPSEQTMVYVMSEEPVRKEPQERIPQEKPRQERAAQESALQESVPREKPRQESVPRESTPQESVLQERKPEERFPKERKPTAGDEIARANAAIRESYDSRPFQDYYVY